MNRYKQLAGIHSAQVATTPIAAIITKADLFKREIGLTKIKSVYKQAHSRSEALDITLNSVRNDVCRNFLYAHGFVNLLNMIDSEFSNVQYFSVSAMGHEAVAGMPYEPWGVVEPVSWLTEQAGFEL